MKSTGWSFLGLLSLAVLAAPVAAQDDAAALGRAMAARHLVQEGKYWICPAEVRLRQRLAVLDRQEAAFHPAWKKFRDASGEYYRMKTQLTRLRDALEQIQTQLGDNSLAAGRRQQLQGEQKKLSDRVLELERKTNRRLGALDAHASLNQIVIDLVNTRNAVAVALLQIEREMDALDARYRQLDGDTALAQLLDSAAGPHTLGPMENYRRRNRATLDRLSRLVFAEGVPFYRRSGQDRLSLIVNEQAPITFSMVGRNGPTLVSESLLTAAGVEVSANAPQADLEIGQRRITARRAVLPTLRVGQHVIRNVPVYALPPEAEDLGARISLNAFGEYQADLDADRLWFRLQ